ncbi:MAG: NAD(P)-dependent oxidoreductase [Saprospiraceae bacterium]
MTPRILIAEPTDFSPAAVARLREVAEVNADGCREDEVQQALRDYDVFWFRLGRPINDKVLDENSRVKILATPVTGIDHIDEALCARLGVKIICLRGEREFLKSIRATAELTIALLFMVMRNLPAAAGHVKDGGWDRDKFRGHELYEKTAGIIGCGRLGNIVAGYLTAMGMRVITYDPRADIELPAGVERVAGLSELLDRSEIVSLHVNYTPENHHLIGPAEFKQLRPNAWFINTSRGGLVDETALLAALQSGRLAGAGLDVIQQEHQLNADNPLIHYARKHRELVILPHIGGNTYESFERTELFIAEKVIAELNRRSR